MLFNNSFAEFLAENKVLSKEKALEWQERANANTTTLHTELVKNNVLDEEVCYMALAKFFGLEYRFYQLSEVDLDFIQKYPRDKLIEYKAIPLFERDGTLNVLTCNPFRAEELKELLPYGGKKLNVIIGTQTQTQRLLDYMNNRIQQDSVLKDYSDVKKKDSSEIDEKDVPIDAPIIKLCDAILKDAINRGASDIHIEPFDGVVYIRYRIDGQLQKNEDLSPHLFPALLARYKIMSGMNIAERRVPQDGKINMEINGLQYDFRVSTTPTLHGEKIVIRIYNLSFSTANIEHLGFSKKQTELVLNMISRPHGILLLTGPTGSGKSTTLYTFLRYLNNEKVNIMTVEDPVENEIKGINQVQVNPKANLTFANTLRSFLRQDPNVIMVGEIRDEETAQIATRAAITGHLVLSSIHTNDAAGVVTRLINMGIPKYLVADSLLGAISQRLVRRLCPKCKKAHRTSKAETALLGLEKSHKIYEAVGCPYCNNTGYLGRIGVFEIMVVTDEIREIVMSDDFTSEKISELLEKNMVTILDHTKERVLAGETSLEEYDSLIDIVK